MEQESWCRANSNADAVRNSHDEEGAKPKDEAL